MTKLIDILNKHLQISTLIKDWGYNNPRLFKGIIIKSDNYIRDEEHNLNFLVDEDDDLDQCFNKRMLELDLEKLLCCKVIISLKEEFNEESQYKIDEAISFDDKPALTSYFGNEWQFTELNLSEEASIRQKEAYEHLDFIKNGFIQERRNKRKRKEGQTQLAAIPIPSEEINTINEIEKQAKSLSPHAFEELYLRIDKHRKMLQNSKLAI